MGSEGNPNRSRRTLSNGSVTTATDKADFVTTDGFPAHGNANGRAYPPDLTSGSPTASTVIVTGSPQRQCRRHHDHDAGDEGRCLDAGHLPHRKPLKTRVIVACVLGKAYNDRGFQSKGVGTWVTFAESRCEDAHAAGLLVW